jgi:hypothetical protein
MRELIKAAFWLGAVLVLLLFCMIMWMALGSQDNQRQRRNDPVYAAEGQQAVEEFLRTDAASALKQLKVTNDLGSFLRLDGTGFTYPSWNIQGYHFLDLRRTAQFSAGALPIRIIVTEGKVTAPGQNTVGKPKVENDMISVSHPDLQP